MLMPLRHETFLQSNIPKDTNTTLHLKHVEAMKQATKLAAAHKNSNHMGGFTWFYPSQEPVFDTAPVPANVVPRLFHRLKWERGTGSSKWDVLNGGEPQTKEADSNPHRTVTIPYRRAIHR